jgi:putative transposase
MQIFDHAQDFAAFERVVGETLRVAPMRICGFCWLPNHWHFVLWPRRDGDLSDFVQRMANMHTQRWQRAKGRVGYGHLYQGRFKSFPIETDEHFYTVMRYAERNALRANLVGCAEEWPWGSMH